MQKRVAKRHLDFKIFHSEYRWVLYFAILTMLLTTLPYIIGFRQQGAQWRFTGFVVGVDDGNSYIAKMFRGTSGDWLFRTPYTAYFQKGVLAYLPYILLGKLAVFPASIHNQLVLLFHLFRFLAGICMIFATYDFIGLFIGDVRLRRLGIFIASLGGGLGWLLLLFGSQQMGLEFYSPESFGFLTLFGLPHLAMARALLFWGLIIYLRKDQPPFLSGILWLVMGLFQPLYVPLVWVVVTAQLILWSVHNVWREINNDVQWSEWRHWVVRWAWTVGISAPIVIYTFLAFNRDAVLRQWTAQNLILSPQLWLYLAAYGLLIPFAVLGIKEAWVNWSARSALLAGWVAVFPFLVYAPYNLQRRLAEGFWVVLVILFLLALAMVNKRWLKLVGVVLILTLLPSAIFLYGAFMTVNHVMPPQYRPADEVAAFNYLKNLSDGEDVVLSSFQTGNPLPAWAPVFVVIGHGPESVFLSELRPRVTSFYKEGTGDEQRKELLSEFGVDYVFWGPHERLLGNWQPASADYLIPIFQEGDYFVFRVNPAELK